MLYIIRYKIFFSIEILKQYKNTTYREKAREECGEEEKGSKQ